MKTSFIIPTLNRQADLFNCLESLYKNTIKPDEIIKRWDLNEYDFSEEIISHFNIWKVNDKVGEMILL